MLAVKKQATVLLYSCLHFTNFQNLEGSFGKYMYKIMLVWFLCLCHYFFRLFICACACIMNVVTRDVNFPEFYFTIQEFNSRDMSSTRIWTTLTHMLQRCGCCTITPCYVGVCQQCTYVCGEGRRTLHVADIHVSVRLLQGCKDGRWTCHGLSNVNYLTATHSFQWPAVFIAKLAARFPAA